MANHAVENLSHFHVSVVVHRNDLGTRSILTLVVSHLPNVLRQFVDCQAWPSVDRLSLHRTASGEHIRWPLPLVIRTACIKTQVVNLIFTAFSQRRHRQIQTGACRGQNVRRTFLRLAAFSYCASSRNACVVCHYLILLKTLLTVALTLTLPSFFPLHCAI